LIFGIRPRHLLGACALVAVCLVARSGRAQTPVNLQVARAPESERCPDAAQILDQVRQLFPQVPLASSPDSRSADLQVSIAIRRSSEGQEALLTVWGRRRGQRRIVDRDEDCRGLAHALAVALVLLVEPDAEPRPREAGSAPPLEPGSARPNGLGALTVEGGALAGAGILGRTLAFGGHLGAGIWHASGAGFRARAVRLGALPAHREGGEVWVDLWAAVLGPCWQLPTAHRWWLRSCLELGWGRQHGQARGYVVDSSATKPWLVLGPSLTLGTTVTGPLEAMFTGLFAGRLHEQRFSVATDRGRVMVQEQALIGVALGLSLAVRWPFSGGRPRYH
jgi:hypothetical protein